MIYIFFFMRCLNSIIYHYQITIVAPRHLLERPFYYFTVFISTLNAIQSNNKKKKNLAILCNSFSRLSKTLFRNVDREKRYSNVLYACRYNRNNNTFNVVAKKLPIREKKNFRRLLTEKQQSSLNCKNSHESRSHKKICVRCKKKKLRQSPDVPLRRYPCKYAFFKARFIAADRVEQTAGTLRNDKT